MSKPIMPGLNKNKIDRGSSRESLGVKYIKSFKNFTLANHPLSVCFLNCEGIKKEMQHKVDGISKSTDKKQVKVKLGNIQYIYKDQIRTEYNITTIKNWSSSVIW